jgi:hypothetical protein
MKLAEQELPQLMSPKYVGSVTVPLPLPELATVRVNSS